MNYSDFIRSKQIADTPSGFDVSERDMNKKLFPWQRIPVKWGCRRGRAAFFEDCGLGKTLQQLENARLCVEQTKHPSLILAPLAVAQQTLREAEKFGYNAGYYRDDDDFAEHDIVITNYECLHNFHPEKYGSVHLDESSILKNYAGKTRNQIIDAFRNTPYRFAYTATPAPNDFMELGNHAEFLGVMSRAEMLATFFVHDGGDTSQWRLKGHAEEAFWRWLCSWAVCIRTPSDIGYPNKGYELPKLIETPYILDSAKWTDGFLFPMPAQSLSEQRQVKRDSIEERCQLAAKLARKAEGACVVWCELNEEGDRLEKLIRGSVQVKGSDSLWDKERAIVNFIDGKFRVLVSKGKIFGHGLNLQHCWNSVHANITHSAEQYYQMIRRFYRFGQKHDVYSNLIMMDAEMAILENVKRKQAESDRMQENMMRFMREYIKDAQSAIRDSVPYEPKSNVKMPDFLRSA